MQPLYKAFDIFKFNDFTSYQNLDDEIMLIDNLENDESSDDSYFRNYPIKLTFNAAIMCIEGNISFKLNLNDLTIEANDMLILQTGDLGEFISISEDCRLIIIAFKNDYFQTTQYPGLSISLHRMFNCSPKCHLEMPMVTESVEIYKMMKSKIAQTDNKYRTGALMGYIQVLLNNAYFYFEKYTKQSIDVEVKSNRKEEIFNRFLAAVQRDYRCHRSITHYAEILCLTPKHLSQVVQQVSGKLASEWIKDYVMLEAKAILKSKKYTIQQVSDMLNFPNQSFFGRYFKKHAGCAPSAYQKL